MSRTLEIALSEYTLQLDQHLQVAIDKFCTPENLASIIETEAYRTMDEIVKDEVNAWFIYGDGKQIIREAVEKRLSSGTIYALNKGKD